MNLIKHYQKHPSRSLQTSLRGRVKCFFSLSKNKKDEGAYAVQDKYGDKVLFLFEEEDDAIRYAMMLEDEEETEMMLWRLMMNLL